MRGGGQRATPRWRANLRRHPAPPWAPARRRRHRRRARAWDFSPPRPTWAVPRAGSPTPRSASSAGSQREPGGGVDRGRPARDADQVVCRPSRCRAGGRRGGGRSSAILTAQTPGWDPNAWLTRSSGLWGRPRITGHEHFSRSSATPPRAPTSSARAVLAAPGFGAPTSPTHMVRIDFDAGQRVGARGQVVPYGAADPRPPRRRCLHYGPGDLRRPQGLPPSPDGVRSPRFRPDVNAVRFARSAQRPGHGARCPASCFLESAARAGRGSTRRGWGRRAPDESAVPAAVHDCDRGGARSQQPRRGFYTYLLIASPAGAYFLRRASTPGQGVGSRPSSPAPLRAARVRPSAAANYAAAFRRAGAGHRAGVRPGRSGSIPPSTGGSRRWGGMNLYFVYGSGARRPHRPPQR